jgi:hypothetical protein
MKVNPDSASPMNMQVESPAVNPIGMSSSGSPSTGTGSPLSVDSDNSYELNSAGRYSDTKSYSTQAASEEDLLSFSKWFS